jgi:hypothetical protein
MANSLSYAITVQLIAHRSARIANQAPTSVPATPATVPTLLTNWFCHSAQSFGSVPNAAIPNNITRHSAANAKPNGYRIILKTPIALHHPIATQL